MPVKKSAPKPKKLAPKKLQQIIIDALDDAKAQDITVLDVRKMTDIADFMIIASGTSTRHVSSIAGRVADKLAEFGRKPLGHEGKDTGEWVLIDYGDVVVHVMRPQTRDFYNLEKLWSHELREEESQQESELEQRVRQSRARK